MTNQNAIFAVVDDAGRIGRAANTVEAPAAISAIPCDPGSASFLV